MAGPIIRQGVIQLGVEIKAPKFSAAPIAAALAQQQKAAATALNQTSQASEAVATSLDLQRAAEEKAIEAEARAVDMARIVASEKSIAAKQAKALADAVDIEASSVAKASSISSDAAANQAALDAANLKVAQSYQKAAVGALTMSRGFLLLASGGDTAIAATLRKIFVVQGLIDVSKGAISVASNLRKAYIAQAVAAGLAAKANGALAASMLAVQAAGGPWVLLLTAVGAVVVAVWDRVAGAAARAEKAQADYAMGMQQLAANLADVNSRAQIQLDTELELASLMATAEEKQNAYVEVLQRRAEAAQLVARAEALANRGDVEPEVKAAGLQAAIDVLDQQKAAGQALVAIEQEQHQIRQGEIKDQMELVKLREREFQVAKDALKVEEDKSKALRAQIGALNQGEQRKLKRLLEAADSGALSRKQALDLQKLGGQAGQDIAEVFLSQMDKGLGDLAEKTRAKVTGEDPRGDAQAEFQRRQSALNKETGGKAPEARIAELQAQNDKLVETMRDNVEQLLEVVRDNTRDIERLRIENSRQQQAVRARNHK